MSRNGPWMSIGDFSEIKNNSEKRGGPSRPESSFTDFRRMIQVCDFQDLKHTRDPFSWMGKRYSHDVACCLDWTMVNSKWIAKFPASQAEFLELIESDHRPVITTITNDFSPRKGHFYFDSRMVNREGLAMLYLKVGQSEDQVKRCVSAPVCVNVEDPYPFGKKQTEQMLKKK
ncbi:PREDICTED: uncharacterized protein LOC104783499 [Camelina sativa]|uniref:Uncharacterized protein LOC104783499 n=1 Tax=Camelina sativa TaxID=90675 RepID=A0ABM0YWL8_CAMSA|nr:PREDICTED: uncharacterized protein LOC104783499 [Camelina sativa]